jgi:hypothetical protein
LPVPRRLEPGKLRGTLSAISAVPAIPRQSRRISNHRKNGRVGDFEIPATPYLWKTLQAEPHSGQSSSLSQSGIGILQFGQIHHLPSLK